MLAQLGCYIEDALYAILEHCCIATLLFSHSEFNATWAHLMTVAETSCGFLLLFKVTLTAFKFIKHFNVYTRMNFLKCKVFQLFKSIEVNVEVAINWAKIIDVTSGKPIEFGPSWPWDGMRSWAVVNWIYENKKKNFTK